MFKNGFICAILLLFSMPVTFPQSDSVFILPEFTIFQQKNGTTISYDFKDYNYNKITLSDSILRADPKLYNYKVNIHNIDKISFREGSQFWTGAGIAAGVGFLSGIWFWGNFSMHGTTEFKFNQNTIGAAFVTAIPFGLIGGLIGLMFPKYEDYEVYKVIKSQRSKYIKRVFIRNSVVIK